MSATIEDCKKLELKTALIESVEAHPDADRLYVLQIKIGDEKRQIVAGIKKFYGPDELIGKTIVIVANLEPAVIRGVESQGMLLAAKDEEGLALVTPERRVRDGVLVG